MFIHQISIFITFIIVMNLHYISFAYPMISLGKVKIKLNKIYMSGYIPPELDPEYRNVVIQSRVPTSSININMKKDNSTIVDNVYSSYPYPKEGDIVLYKGRWGDKQIGRIRFMRYIESYGSFYADIIPLIEGKSENVFIIDRKSQAEFLSIDDVSPVKSYFMRNENGYKLYYNTKVQPKEIILRAPKYNKADKTYSPRSKVINYDILDTDLKDYEELKNRIYISTLQIGVVIALGLGLGYQSMDIAGSYYLGVLGSCLYFFLLGKKVENIGDKYSALLNRPSITDNIANPSATTSSSSEDGVDSMMKTENTTEQTMDYISKMATKRFSDNFANIRLAVPLLMIGILASKSYLFDGLNPKLFSFIPQSEYIATMAGFLTLRIAIYFKEVGKEFRAEDLIGIVPGSLAITLRQMLFNQKPVEDTNKSTQDTVEVPSKVVFITGPSAAGRLSLVSKLLNSISKEDRSNQFKQYHICKLLTTDTRYSKSDSEWYQYITADDLNKLRLQQDVLYEGLERDLTGTMISVALSKKILSATTLPIDDNNNISSSSRNSKTSYKVIMGPPALLDSLAAMNNIVSTNIWISMQSKEQFIKEASSMLMKGAEESVAMDGGDASTVAKLSAEKVVDLVNEAAKDINFYMQKAPLFDYTIINTSDEYENAIAELKDLFQNLR